jgi:hypothetical protein
MHPTNRTFPPAFGFNDPGITWTPDGYQHDPKDVFDRIDFVHFSDGDGVAVTSSTDLDARNSVSPWPSDHRAVVSTFTLTPPVPLAKASRPFPASGAAKLPLTNQLSWLPGSNATAHIIRFGTNSPGSLVTTQANATFNPGALAPGATYYWRVDELTPSGVVTGDVWTFTTSNPNAASIYEWTFERADLAATLGAGTMAFADEATRAQAAFSTSDGATVPNINGQQVRYLRVPALTGAGNGCHLTFGNSGPNGSGTYINRFTFIADVLVPGPVAWAALFNTNPQNANDADWYVDADGRLGIGALAYSPPGTITANTWHRIAFAADLGAGVVTFYRDGSQVAQRTGSSLLDGRFSLYSNADAGPDLLLFNEGDSSGVYTHELLVSSIAFTDRTLSAAEMAALGGPHAEGIFAQHLRIRREGQTIQLGWRSGPRVRLQRTAAFFAAWETVPGTGNTTNLSELLDGVGAFYRLVLE